MRPLRLAPNLCLDSKTLEVIPEMPESAQSSEKRRANEEASPSNAQLKKALAGIGLAVRNTQIHIEIP